MDDLTTPPVSPGISEERFQELLLAENVRAAKEGGPIPRNDAVDALASEVRRLRQQVERLRSALERTEANFKSAFNGRPVPDMGENLAENALALGSSHG